jgi:hypothetical protein
MALKNDRHLLYDDIRYFCNDVTERGVILCHSGSGGSGVSLDNILDLVYLCTGQVSGVKPAGLLINDIVDVDETRFHINYAKDEMRVGSKCHLLKKGWVITDKLVSGQTPKAGDPAYLAPSGSVTTSSANSAPRVGTFKNRKDGNNFVTLEVDIDSY